MRWRDAPRGIDRKYTEIDCDRKKHDLGKWADSCNMTGSCSPYHPKQSFIITPQAKQIAGALIVIQVNLSFHSSRGYAL
jgi:hypothetical protein